MDLGIFLAISFFYIVCLFAYGRWRVILSSGRRRVIFIKMIIISLYFISLYIYIYYLRCRTIQVFISDDKFFLISLFYWIGLALPAWPKYEKWWWQIL